MKVAMRTAACHAIGLTALLALAGAAAPAEAQSSLSEESTKRLMQYAWAQTPGRFTLPDGKVIEIDKKEPAKVQIPVDVAREVIVAGRRSALAQMCELEDQQVSNYRSLMLREEQKKKWSEQQMVYINMLHLTVVQIFSGDVTITVEEGGDKKVVNTEPQNKRKTTCSDAEKAKLKEQIDAYVAQGPKLESTAAAAPPATPAAPQSTGSVTPASTTKPASAPKK